MTSCSPRNIVFGKRWHGFSSRHRILCALLASLQILLPGLAAALPSDGNVVGGNATIQHTTPNSLTIQQTTDKAIINWNSFSIAANEAVRFVQPSISSIALNRVVGVDPSVILGHLQSNGHLFLINPNGILFGAGAQINVGGLLATTLQIRNDDFMAGRYLFTQDPLKEMRTVINRGTIQVSDHGYVFLVAPGVSNEGVIVANLGKVVLGSGQKLTIDLMGDGLINYAISGKVLGKVTGPDGKPLSSAVSNSGNIQADGGQVILQAKASGDIFSSVVNQSGVIRARSLENHGGVVQLLGGDETLVAATAAGAMRPVGEVSGAVVNTGTLDVAAAVPKAAQGSVTMAGERVGQYGAIIATGADGTNGGDVLIASTARTVLASGSTIDVSGAGHSSGGRLRVWSDHDTLFNAGATIFARAGGLGGNGGFVELSGKEQLGFAGTVNALAPFGQAGTLLLDPRNITIATAGGVAYNPGVNNLFGNNVGATTIITPASINGQLANVVLQANSDITVTNAIGMTNAGVGITMQAGRSIAVNANVSTTNGNISLIANDSTASAADRLAGVGNITMGAGTTLNAGSGNISLTIGNSAVAPFNPGGITAQALTTTAGTISLQSTTASTIAGNVSLGSGLLSLNNAGALTISGVVSGTGGLTMNGAGTLTLSGNNTYTGATNINAGTLTLGATNRIANTSAVTVAGGATFNLNSFAETIGSLSGAGNVTLGTATLTTGDATNTTYSGVMSGTGGLTKQGAGVMTLSGANTYTGATAINAGTLQLSGGAAIADTSAVTLANVAGATLDLNGTNETISSLAGGGALGGNVTLGAGTLTTGAAANTTYTGIISGTGSLTKQGAGIFTLSGANTYTGTTTINAGTLTLGAANRLADTSAVVVNAGTFNLNNFSETVGSLAGAGAVTLGTGTLTAGGDNSSTTYSGIMSGTGGLTKLGTGTLTLSGNNTYTGTTNINVGTLVAAANNALGTVAGSTTVSVGATLGFSGGINYSTAETVTLNGGTLSNLAGNNTFAGPITLTASSAIAVADGTTMTIGGTINGGSSLTVSSGTGGIDFLGAIGGTTPLSSLTATVGSLSLGPVTTVGTQTYTGITTLNGNLTTTNSAVTLNSPVTLGANTILSVGTGSITFGNSLNGAFSLTANSTGTTTFSGAVGTTTSLTSLTTNAGGSTAINGGAVTTSGNQTYNDNVTMNQSTTLNSAGGAITFGAIATNNAAGAAITVDAPAINLTGGTTVATTGNGAINFFTDTLNPNGASINAGTAAFSLSPNTLTNTIEFGDVNTARVTNVYYGSNFGSIMAGSFTIGRLTHTGNIFVTGVAAAPSVLNIVNGGAGSVTFENAPYVSGNQNLGVVSGSGGITLGNNLTLGTGTLRLTSSGAITQTGGTITANIAGLYAASGITLGQPTNNVTTLAAQTTAGSMTFADTDGFTIDAVSATVDGFHPAITGLSAAGAVTLQSGGAVTQTQRILASALNLQASGPYTLTNNANDVTTLTANTTGNVRYNNANALALGGSNISGNFDITTGGAITQSGALSIAGTTTLSAGANDITLTNGSNNFATVGIVSGNNVSVTDANGLTLAASTVSGALNVTTNGALTQSGGLNVTGATTLSAGATNDITLTDAANTFSTVGVTSGNNVALTDANDLVMGASTVSGNLALTTGGTLSQTGVLAVTGTTSFTATAATTDVLLDTQANNFGGSVSFAGTQFNFRDVQLRNVNAGASVPALAGLTNLRNLTLTFDSAPITLPALTASGNLNLMAGGSITQSGVLAVGGTTTLASTVAGSDLLLDTQANNLGSAVLFGGTLANIRDVGLRNINAGASVPSLAGLTNLRNLTLTFNNAPITLPALVLTAGGNLSVTAGGSITQTGAVTIPGSTTLATTVAGSDILLDTQANNFGGAVAFGGTQADVRDLGLRNVSPGAIVPALAGLINLRNLTLTFDNAPMILPSLTVSGNLTATAGGLIGQSGALSVGGNASFNTAAAATLGSVNLANGSALTLGSSIVGGDFTVTTMAGDLTLPAGQTLTVVGDTTLTSAGNVNLLGTTSIGSMQSFIGGTASTFVLSIDSNLNALPLPGTGNVTVNTTGTTATFAGGPLLPQAINLSNTSNSFGGSVSVTTAAPAFTGSTANTYNLTQSAPVTLGVGRTLTVTDLGGTAGKRGNITLTDPANNFDQVNFTGGNIAWAETGPVTVGAIGVSANAGSTSTGTLAITSTGAITQTGAVTAAGFTTLTAGGANNITLTNGGNNFSTVGITSGHDVALADSDALTLGASTIGGTLNVTTGGTLAQSGALNVIGVTTLAAGVNDITLNNPGNNFSAVGVTSGSNVALTDANALTMNASAVSGNIAVIAHDLTIGGPVASTGGSLNLTGASSVTQLASVTVNGANTVTVTATSGPLTMAPAAITSSGTGAITYTSGTDVTLGSLSTGGGVNVSAGGSVLSAAGSGTNVTAGANSMLQAFSGVVGTLAAPLTVNVNPGTLSIRATTAIAGISANLTGTVFPSNALTLLNVPPGLVCLITCPVVASNNLFPFGSFGFIPSFNRDSVIPSYLQEPSDPPLISIVSTYLPQTVVAQAKTDVKSDDQSVARAIPPCFPESACKPGASVLTAPADGGDPELPTAK